MNINAKMNNNAISTSYSLDLKGYWKFENDFSDASGYGNDLSPNHTPSLIKDSNISGAVRLDGSKQFLGTKNSVVDTEDSYTVAAWVRLDSSAMNGKLSLKPGEHALTAVSQDTATHSNFYLGLRQVDKEQPDGVLTSSLRWNFTVSPIDGSETGPVDWQHAHAESHLDDSDLDKWFLLVGVCDTAAKTASIYVPTVNEKGTIHWPVDLVQLPVEGGFQVGRGRWLGKDVDHWPGSIGPIKVFSGAMSQEEVNKLYNNSEL